jgi:hypothetical protein
MDGIEAGFFVTAVTSAMVLLGAMAAMLLIL